MLLYLYLQHVLFVQLLLYHDPQYVNIVHSQVFQNLQHEYFQLLLVYFYLQHVINHHLLLLHNLQHVMKHH